MWNGSVRNLFGAEGGLPMRDLSSDAPEGAEQDGGGQRQGTLQTWAVWPPWSYGSEQHLWSKSVLVTPDVK
jgi:hypothetical protein